MAEPDAKTGARLASFQGNTGSLSSPSLGAGKLLWSTWDGKVRALAAPDYPSGA